MTTPTELIDAAIKQFGSAKLADSNVVIDVLLDIRQAIKEDGGGQQQENHQTETEGPRIPEPV